MPEDSSHRAAPLLPNPELQQFREKVTARLAGAVVFLFAAALLFGFIYIGDENFGQVKDIISILTPIVGVVLGYYFNKTSTEGRAEHAEHTAHAATQLAQQAAQERNEAHLDAAVATESLHEVSTAAEQMLAAEQYPTPVDDAAEVPFGAAGDTAATMTAERIRLEHALERARRVRTIRPRR